MATYDPPLLHCLICGSDDLHEYHRDANDIKIFRCDHCRIQFMNPQYADKHIADYYSLYTREEPEWDEPLQYGHNFYLKLIETYVPAKGALLDVGAGKGHFISVALQREWRTSGYEIDCTVAKKLAEKLGIEVKCGNFTTIDWHIGKFDAVAMHHVIEHLKNPVIYLQTIHSMLRAQGLLFLVLPNIHSLSSRFKFFLEKMHVRKNNIGAYYDTTHHLWYFTPTTLRQTLSRFGFKLLYMRSGHRVRPNQSKMKRFIMRNITERNLLHSTFLCIAQKQSFPSRNR